MIKAYKIALMTCLLFFINSLSAKIYYGLGAEKVKKKGYKFSMAQLDSEADFAVINSQITGIGRRGKQFFSPTGKFIVEYAGTPIVK